MEKLREIQYLEDPNAERPTKKITLKTNKEQESELEYTLMTCFVILGKNLTSI
jgi:hypothetical protein